MRFTTILLLLTVSIVPALADNWPQWRGPQGTGISDEVNLPLTWSAEENIRWRTPLPGPGNSTPIVWEDRVFVSGAEDEGRLRTLMCFQRDNGELQWKRVVEFADDEPTHKTNPYCSSSPVTNGEIVVVWHGSAGLHAYDLDGNEIWQRDLGQFQHIWGNASSPVFFEDLLILNCGPGLRAFTAAFNVQDGETAWQIDPPIALSEKVGKFRGSWSTPVMTRHGDETVLLLQLPNELWAVNPQDGEQIWMCGGLGDLAYSTPLVEGDIIVAMSGFNGPAIAVRNGGSGDVTETHRLWLHEERNPQRVGSGVIVDGHIYILNASGIAWCIELESGEIVWQERLAGKSWCSMVYADGRIYASNEDGLTYVLDPSPEECRVLAENDLGELTRASPAISDGQIFLRTYEALYCIEQDAPTGGE